MTNAITGKEEVVVTGGFSGSGAIASTEIYTVEDDTWRDGTDLPRETNAGASVPYGDTFLFVGGTTYPCYDEIYKVYFLKIAKLS